MSEAAPLAPDLLAKINVVVAEHEIRKLLLTCCRGIDRGDANMVMACFHEDARVDYGYFAGPASILVASAPRNPSTHYLANCLVDVVDRTATSESYILACQVVDPDGVPHTRVRSARYLDRFERRDGEWRIVSRVLIDDWSRLDPIGAVLEEVGQHRGTRSSDDPSYFLIGLDKEE